MEATTYPRIKICCIANWEEAQLAIQHGVDALGLVADMPSGPGVITDEKIRSLAGRIPPPVSSFLLTSRTESGQIAEHIRATGASTVQIVDSLTNGSYQHIRLACPGVNIVQVIHVQGEASIAEALAVAPLVDALLLDSGNAKLKVKKLGGTGRTHNWQISRKIREQVSVPIFLAGGLHPGNVREAIKQVGPFGLDVCSGVRTHNKLDEVKVKAFMKAIKSRSIFANLF
ncbi:MAG: phosphoribosylanthranilate isomerase [Bacteroidota bacterium]